MKNIRIRFWVCGAVTGILGVGLCWSLLGQVPNPALTIQVSGTNQFLLKITNGVSYANYEIYRRSLFDPAYPWTLHLIGSQGQTNFTAYTGIETIGFFQAIEGLDWDQDGVDNWLDGDPSSTNVGVLNITIDGPVHGTIFN